MPANSPTVAEAAAQYIATLPQETRPEEQRELNRFVWWFGSDRRVDDLTGITIESYQEQVEKSGADTLRRLDPVKSFLTFAQKQKYLGENLSKFIKIRRANTGRKKESASRAALPTQPAEETIQLTREGHARMKQELEHLTTVVRRQVAHDLVEARRDRDIRENAPYDAAKQHQALVEARIRELSRILGSAEVVDETQVSDRVAIGSTVVLRDMTHGDELRYTLVSPDEVNPRQGKISTASPVGKALLDREEGDVIEVSVPAGTLRYKVERLER